MAKNNLIALAFVAVVFIPVYWGVRSAQYLLEERNPPQAEQRESVDWFPEHDGVEGDRSGMWPTVRKHYLLKHPVCEACGTDEDLNVHHVKPFHKHPELELDESNLVTACREHHFYICHDPDGPWGELRPNWKLSNPNALADMKKWKSMHKK